MDLLSLTAVELGKKIKAGEITTEEAVRATLAAIEAKEPQINSFVTVDRENALKKAAQVQKQIKDGTLTGPLAGVPVAVKDNLCTKGVLTTCSSKILYNFIPTYTAEAVCNLEKAGAVVIGKTNMDEFAMGSTTETSAYGVTRNPWNTAHVPGGSSGGSCAAVAAEEICCALGSDTGGSIPQPRSFCRVRYRRFHPSDEILLRCNGYQADIRNCFTIWANRLRFFFGPDWAGGKGCDRLCGNIGNYQFPR